MTCHVAERRTERILARVGNLGLDTRQLRRQQVDFGDLLEREIACHGDRRAADFPLRSRDQLLLNVRRDGHDARQQREHGLNIAGLRRLHEHTKQLLVCGKNDPAAIENTAAHRGKQLHAQPVVIRQRRVTAALHHLQLIETAAQRPEGRNLAEPHQHGAAREASAEFGIVSEVVRHRPPPRLNESERAWPSGELKLCKTKAMTG